MIKAIAACALLMVASLPLIAFADESTAVSANPSLSVIARAPDFTLRDTSGRIVSLSDYRGRAVLLAFIFTTCPGVCPLISQQMANLQANLKANGLFNLKANLISVTVDPETDSAAKLREYAASYGADLSGWRFLRETPDRTKPVLTSYDEWTRLLPKGEIDHPARVYLIDQQGNIREIYSLAFFNEKQAFIDMRVLISQQDQADPKH